MPAHALVVQCPLEALICGTVLLCRTAGWTVTLEYEACNAFTYNRVRFQLQVPYNRSRTLLEHARYGWKCALAGRSPANQNTKSLLVQLAQCEADLCGLGLSSLTDLKVSTPSLYAQTLHISAYNLHGVLTQASVQNVPDECFAWDIGAHKIFGTISHILPRSFLPVAWVGGTVLRRHIPPRLVQPRHINSVGAASLTGVLTDCKLPRGLVRPGHIHKTVPFSCVVCDHPVLYSAASSAFSLQAFRSRVSSSALPSRSLRIGDAAHLDAAIFTKDFMPSDCFALDSLRSWHVHSVPGQLLRGTLEYATICPESISPDSLAGKLPGNIVTGVAMQALRVATGSVKASHVKARRASDCARLAVKSDLICQAVQVQAVLKCEDAIATDILGAKCGAMQANAIHGACRDTATLQWFTAPTCVVHQTASATLCQSDACIAKNLVSCLAGASASLEAASHIKCASATTATGASRSAVCENKITSTLLHSKRNHSSQIIARDLQMPFSCRTSVREVCTPRARSLANVAVSGVSDGRLDQAAVGDMLCCDSVVAFDVYVKDTSNAQTIRSFTMSCNGRLTSSEVLVKHLVRCGKLAFDRLEVPGSTHLISSTKLVANKLTCVGSQITTSTILSSSLQSTRLLLRRGMTCKSVHCAALSIQGHVAMKSMACSSLLLTSRSQESCGLTLCVHGGAEIAHADVGNMHVSQQVYAPLTASHTIASHSVRAASVAAQCLDVTSKNCTSLAADRLKARTLYLSRSQHMSRADHLLKRLTSLIA